MAELFIARRHHFQLAEYYIETYTTASHVTRCRMVTIRTIYSASALRHCYEHDDIRVIASYILIMVITLICITQRTLS